MAEIGQQTLEGRLFFLLAPLIDGRSTVPDIADRLEGRLTPVDVSYGLSLLEREGLLVDEDEDDPAQLAVFGGVPDGDPEDHRQRLQQTPVSVTAVGSVAAQCLVEKLWSLGVRVAEDGDLWVVLVDDYLAGGLSELSRSAQESGRSWLIARPAGAVAWIGPIFDPQRPGCWCCLAERLRRNRRFGSVFEGRGARETEPPAAAPVSGSMLHAALNLVATAVYRWVVQGEAEELTNRLVTINMASLHADSHVLVPDPSCRQCGWQLERSRDPQPVILHSCRRVFQGGGYRAVPPELTWEAIRHHVSPITGIVSELRPHRGDPAGQLHVWVAGPSIARNPDLQRRGIRSTSAGKGVSEIEARVGAVCEALERYSGLFRGGESRRLASWNSLGPAAVHPNSCMLFSQRQLEERERWHRDEAEFNWVPRPFDEEREIEWSPLWSLSQGTCRYLPTAYCYYDYPRAADEDFCRADSNGSAAGNTLEEAILQGFVELVERDAVAVWWYNRLSRPAVDLESFDEPYIRSLQDYHRRLDRELRVLDITSDLGIPAFAAVSGDPGRGGQAVVLGFGAHLDARIALSRALTEINQLLANVLAAPDGRATPLFEGPLEASFLQPDRGATRRKCGDYDQWQGVDLEEAVEHCAAVAARHGMETLVLDQSRPEVGLRVVKVVVPGLRPFWARFAPGRLYDVPVTKGWRDRPLAEDELNPAHLCL